MANTTNATLEPDAWAELESLTGPGEYLVTPSVSLEFVIATTAPAASFYGHQLVGGVDRVLVLETGETVYGRAPTRGAKIAITAA